jgi:hypothetical protein
MPMNNDVNHNTYHTYKTTWTLDSPFLTLRRMDAGAFKESALVGNEKRQFHSSNPSILT